MFKYTPDLLEISRELDDLYSRMSQLAPLTWSQDKEWERAKAYIREHAE